MVVTDAAQQHAALGDDFNFSVIKKYFTVKGWKSVRQAIKVFKRKPQYTCNGCYKEFKKEESSIQCDRCLKWYHWACVLLKKAPKTTNWFVLTAGMKRSPRKKELPFFA